MLVIFPGAVAAGRAGLAGGGVFRVAGRGLVAAGGAEACTGGGVCWTHAASSSDAATVTILGCVVFMAADSFTIRRRKKARRVWSPPGLEMAGCSQALTRIGMMT